MLRRVAGALRDAVRRRPAGDAADGAHVHDDVYPAQFFSTLSPGVVGGAASASCSTSVVARGRLHYLLYNVDEDRSLGYWELAAMVSYDL